MNVVVRILVGGFTGWLTGKAIGQEGYEKSVKDTHGRILDTFYGIVGGIVGEYLFFWMVVGTGSSFSSYATTVLGAITLVGAARLIGAKIRSHRPYQSHRVQLTGNSRQIIMQNGWNRSLRPQESSAAGEELRILVEPRDKRKLSGLLTR
ncbi:MAG TPA: hypothetical protein VFU31_09720 [Candidatus Binatia bacterium]|nr:hypothetical protein [Candidatus Binatia bacterium]